MKGTTPRLPIIPLDRDATITSGWGDELHDPIRFRRAALSLVVHVYARQGNRVYFRLSNGDKGHTNIDAIIPLTTE